MITLSVNNLKKSYGVDTIIENITFAINENENVGIVGPNGAGKTTSIGKLAKQFQKEGHGVLLAAGDTFRAAAREQLAEWGRRNDVTVVAQESGDPAAVVFDAIAAEYGDEADRYPFDVTVKFEAKVAERVATRLLTAAGAHVICIPEVFSRTVTLTYSVVAAFAANVPIVHAPVPAL